MLRDAPAKYQRLPFSFAGLSLRHALPLALVGSQNIGRLHQQPATNALQLQPVIVAWRGGSIYKTQVPFYGQPFERWRLITGGDHGFHEKLRQGLSCCGVHSPVERDHGTERRHRIDA